MRVRITFIQSLIDPFTHAFNHSFIHRFIRSFLHSFFFCGSRASPLRSFLSPPPTSLSPEGWSYRSRFKFPSKTASKQCDIHAPKPYKLIGFGDIHGPKPCKFIGFGDIHSITLRFLIHDFWGRPEIVDFRGLGGPGGPGNHSKYEGRGPPYF